MDGFDSHQLIQSIDALTAAVKDASEIIGEKLEEIDQSLARLAAQGVPGEAVPLRMVVEKMANAAGGVALQYLQDWEKRSGINGG